MSIISRYIEAFFGRVFYNYKQRDAGLFTKRVIFKDTSSLLVVECPELGETNILKRKHTPFGENELPTLAWSSDADTLQRIKEFVLIVEDADVPVPSPIVHGLFYGMPSNLRSLSHRDLLAIKNDESTGMKYGLNFRKNLYSGARPILNHGQHRYFFQLVGLNSQLRLVGGANINEVARAMKEKIVAYGIWTGVYERRLHEND
jgi:phosphatidylethanolamine-binding protein (PEBP) family uncharacterized protein